MQGHCYPNVKPPSESHGSLAETMAATANPAAASIHSDCAQAVASYTQDDAYVSSHIKIRCAI